MKKIQKITQKCIVVFTLIVAFVSSTNTGFAQDSDSNQGFLKSLYPGITPVFNSEDLLKVTIPNTVIESADMDSVKDFCLVTAIVNHPPSNDQVKVWIALPVKNWNGRFLGNGGAGYTGGLKRSLYIPASQGFATGATDAGHVGGNGDFAYDTENERLKWQEVRDFAYLGIHDMTIVGKALAEAFYGKPARYSYFVGGSTGGRQGITSAQRYPEDYDGITAACPALNTQLLSFGHLWPVAVMNDANYIVSKEKLAAVTKAVVLACDGDDGVVDGVIEDPLHCTWDPKNFVGTAVGDEIFTEADEDVVRKIWEGPRTHDGKLMWYPINRGADLSALAGSRGNPLRLAPFSIGPDWVKYFLLLDPDWDYSTLTSVEYELLWNQSVDQYYRVFNVKPDLSQFRGVGGKIIMSHGLGDQLIPAQGTIRFYEQLLDQMGGEKAVLDFARLFLVPGVDHGYQGAAPAPVNTLETIVRWVEEGEAPERLLAEEKDENGNVIRTRPLFPYPNVARYKGSGSTDDAANFKKVTVEYKEVLNLDK